MSIRAHPAPHDDTLENGNVFPAFRGTMGSSVNSDSTGLVISQIYGGGGNVGATYQNDFIELYDRGSLTIDLSSWSVQYASASGNTWQVVNLSGTIHPGQYFLIQMGAGSSNQGNKLPNPDVISTIAMSATSGKVALLDTTARLYVDNPAGNSNLHDFVGYGAADTAEGSAAPSPSASTSILRAGSGTIDTNDNAADFKTGAPTPRNTSAEGPATVSIAASDASKAEGDSGSTPFTFVVTRDGGDLSPSCSVDYQVRTNTTPTVNGYDFTGGALPSGTVSFAPGETTKTVTIEVAGDTIVEQDENFAVSLYDATSGVTGTMTAYGIIRDDDKANPPVATADSYDATENATLTVSAANGVLRNDSDADGGTLTAILGTGPAHGSLTLKTDGSFGYAPVTGYHGTDSFTYQARDSTGALSDAAMVTIDVVGGVTITGTAGNDVIAPGRTVAGQLSPTAFGDTLNGLGGADTLDGGAGADTMAGGDGDDTYFVDNAADSVVEAKGGGSDRVAASVSYALASGQEIERLQTTSVAGTGAINLTGNALTNLIQGNAGANTIDGKAGADTMYGFGGDDIFFVDNAGDRIVEAAGGGSDRVVASVSYILGAGQEIERLQTTSVSGTGAINLTGNAFANLIQGNAGANTIDGKGGADTLYGYGGADVFAFTTTVAAGNVARIEDFADSANTVHDRISLARSAFTALSAGDTLSASAFKDVTAGAALDGDDRILYNHDTGALSYDADGSGSAAAIPFARIDNKVVLSAADFIIG